MKAFLHHYGIGGFPVLSDLYLWPIWFVTARKRIAYVPWAFGKTMRKFLR